MICLLNRMEHPEKTTHAIRRSTRLPLEVPVLLTSLGGAPFCEQCNTTLVNAHGCGVIAMRAITRGVRVEVEIVSAKRHTTARVAEVVPLGGDPETWLVGLELETPGNFWGIQYAPSDWKIEEKIEEKPPAAAAEVQVNRNSDAASKRAHPITLSPPISSPVTRRWRLTDISAGACFLESTTPFPAETPVLLSIRTSDTECLLEGVVRVSHAPMGMGVEFTRVEGQDPARVEELISRLKSSREVPRIFVGRKEGRHATANFSEEMPSAEPDPLRELIRSGASLTAEKFLNDLRAQRIGSRPDSRSDLSASVLLPGQP
jgi:hypothetical protein